MSIQLCALCAFVLKNIQNFVDLDAIKKSEVKKQSEINDFFWSDLKHDLNQMI